MKRPRPGAIQNQDFYSRRRLDAFDWALIAIEFALILAVGWCGGQTGALTWFAAFRWIGVLAGIVLIGIALWLGAYDKGRASRRLVSMPLPAHMIRDETFPLHPPGEAATEIQYDESLELPAA